MLARGTTSVCRCLSTCDLICTASNDSRCIGSVTGATFPALKPVARHRLLDRLMRSIVRGAAQGSYSLAFLIPHRSTRGSLFPPCQVLVPVIAVGSSVVVMHVKECAKVCQEGFRRDAYLPLLAKWLDPVP